MHTVISLIGILTGFVVIFGLIAGRCLPYWTGVFLLTTVLTSVTGFGFPLDHLLPSHKVRIFSLVILALVIPALYAFHLSGHWRRVYVIAPPSPST